MRNGKASGALLSTAHLQVDNQIRGVSRAGAAVEEGRSAISLSLSLTLDSVEICASRGSL